MRFVSMAAPVPEGNSVNPVRIGVLACLLVGLALAMPPARAEFRGKVHMLVNPEAPRADWRRIPLAGAYVAVFWSITIPAPAHAITTCRYSELARSNDKGDYVMEGPNLITAHLAHISYLVYSPGLEPINFPYGGSLQTAQDITMALSKLSPDERLSRISGYTDPQCPDKALSDPHHLLDAFHRGLLDEARTLKVESDLGRRELEGIEAAVRRSSGLDRPGPIRAVIVPSTGAIQSSPPNPETKP